MGWIWRLKEGCWSCVCDPWSTKFSPLWLMELFGPHSVAEPQFEPWHLQLQGNKIECKLGSSVSCVLKCGPREPEEECLCSLQEDAEFQSTPRRKKIAKHFWIYLGDLEECHSNSESTWGHMINYYYLSKIHPWMKDLSIKLNVDSIG